MMVGILAASVLGKMVRLGGTESTWFAPEDSEATMEGDTTVVAWTLGTVDENGDGGKIIPTAA